jgi:predicted MFS family arabinose efflux permease
MSNTRFNTLCIALMMFPQIAQTLCSPALPDFARHFGVAPAAATQMPTIYFFCFALGVVGWGRVCDRIGRRAALCGGLSLYAAASVVACFVTTYDVLLVTQALSALGAAVGSVVTQTALRDRYAGDALAKIFSIAGMGIAASPAVGLFAGAAIVNAWGYRGAMMTLFALALVLLCFTAAYLPETRNPSMARTSLLATCRPMMRDASLWRAVLLVAAFNVALFSYYSLGPFVFEQLGLGTRLYGLSGIVLAVGACAGALLNHRLLQRGHRGSKLVAASAMLLLVAGVAIVATQHTAWFLLPMLFVVAAFGLAIPNVLGGALKAYRHHLGTAAAIFGLLYYLAIGAGMLLVSASQSLGAVVIVCGALTMLASVFPYRTHPRPDPV